MSSSLKFLVDLLLMKDIRCVFDLHERHEGKYRNDIKVYCNRNFCHWNRILDYYDPL